MPHGAMEGGRKKKADAHIADGAGDHGRLDRGPHAQRFEYVRAAAQA
jgi:hypothetical protein